MHHHQYVSEPASRPASQERHQDVDARDAELDGAPPSPTNTIKGSAQLGDANDDEVSTESAPVAAGVGKSVSADLSADHLDASESSIESSVIVVAPDEDEIQSHNDEVETSHETSAASVSSPPDTAPPAAGTEVLTSEPEPSPADASLSQPAAIQTAPLTQRSIPNGKTRTRQTSTNSLLKSVNPVEAYLNSDLPHEPDESLPARDIIEIADGHWVSKIPPFKITVPSYSQRKVAKGRGEFTVFQIVSSINAPTRLPTTEEQPESTDGTASEVKEATSGEQDIRHIAVDRRYTHFQHLHTILKASLPLLSIPDLPEKRLTGNFNADFLNSRRRDLERYLSRLTRHNLIRSNKAFLDFLGCENEEVYDANLPRSLMQALRMEPERFFTKIKYASEHFDESQLLEEVKEEQERMARHVRAVAKGQAISSIFDALTAYRDRMQGNHLYYIG